jgi:hypothetical protein
MAHEQDLAPLLAESIKLAGAGKVGTKLHYRGKYDYDALPGHNFSTLKELARSPLHYQHRLTTPRPDTPSLQFGHGSHVAVLEPERFIREFALWQGKDADGKTRQRRGKAWDAFQAEHTGRIILTESDYDRAIALKDAVRADEIAMRYLAAGRPEVALTWTDTETGLPCKGRIDWEGKADGYPAIVDLKSARDPSPRAFGLACARYSYHVQLAFYTDGYEQATGKRPRVVIVAVESTPPHDVVTYSVPADVLEVGRGEYRKWLAKIQECTERRTWFGCGNGFEQTLVLPAWAAPEEEIDWNS